MTTRIAQCLTLAGLLPALFFSLFPPLPAAAGPIAIFPLLGGASYWNDFGAPRDGGARSHEGNDLMGAAKHTPVLAVADGEISFIAYPERDWGMAIYLRANDGYEYRYLHINNDRPGTDDHSALPWYAYATDITEGAKVRAGQVIGWNGDSGNAESTSPHVHFEMRDPSRNLMNPYEHLRASQVLTRPVSPAIQPNEVLPYGDLAMGGNIAVGNFDTDSRLEFATAPRRGGGPHVRLFDDNRNAMPVGFYAYQRDYPGGLDIAAGDLNGDGRDEIITGAGPGGTSHVRTFHADGTSYGVEFLAYPEGFKGGVFVAAADLDGDRKAEIITGAGAGGSAHVRVWSAAGQLRNEWLAYDRAFLGGVDVAAARGAVVTAPGEGGGPHVKVWGPTGQSISNFFAYDTNFRGGLRISARGSLSQTDDRYGPQQPQQPDPDLTDVSDCEVIVTVDSYGRATARRVCPNRIVFEDHRWWHDDDEDNDNSNDDFTSTTSGSLEIAVAPATGGGTDFRMFDRNGRQTARTTAYERWWIGGYDVAIGQGAAYVISASGPSPDRPRRTSVRPLTSSRFSR
jgi:murein DD-endopeptidase MepM/ murein hydrolase activator NlpD